MNSIHVLDLKLSWKILDLLFAVRSMQSCLGFEKAANIIRCAVDLKNHWNVDALR